MKPEVIYDEVFGRLTWDAQLEWWEGSVEISPGQEVEVSIQDEEGEAEESIARARRAYESVRDSGEYICRCAARELLAICNEEWNTGDAFSEDEFIAKMSVDNVTLYPDGAAEVYYDDGGMFRGHKILISVDPDLKARNADIVG